MADALDAHTWIAVIAVVLGFFAVPAAMLAQDLRRRHRLRDRTSGDTNDLTGCR